MTVPNQYKDPGNGRALAHMGEFLYHRITTFSQNLDGGSRPFYDVPRRGKVVNFAHMLVCPPLAILIPNDNNTTHQQRKEPHMSTPLSMIVAAHAILLQAHILACLKNVPCTCTHMRNPANSQTHALGGVFASAMHLGVLCGYADMHTRALLAYGRQKKCTSAVRLACMHMPTKIITVPAPEHTFHTRSLPWGEEGHCWRFEVLFQPWDSPSKSLRLSWQDGDMVKGDTHTHTPSCKQQHKKNTHTCVCTSSYTHTHTQAHSCIPQIHQMRTVHGTRNFVHVC